MRKYDVPIARVVSLAEMKAALDQEVRRVRELHDYRESGRSVFERHLAHYVMAHYFSQPAAVRDRILAEGRATMEERRRSRTPVYWTIEGADDEATPAEALAAAPEVVDGISPNPPVRPAAPKKGAGSK